MDEIVILYNKHDKKSVDFVNSNSSYTAISWYDYDDEKTLLYKNRDLPPMGQSPSVVSTTKKVIIPTPSSMEEALSRIDTWEYDHKCLFIRDKRDYLLDYSDRYLISDFPKGTVTEQQILDYRQSLRDVPAQEGFPDNVVWPVNPFNTQT